MILYIKFPGKQNYPIRNFYFFELSKQKCQQAAMFFFFFLFTVFLFFFFHVFFPLKFSFFSLFFYKNKMGTTSSRESSTRHKYKQKILSIKRGRRSYAKSDISSPFTSTTSIVQPTPVHLVKHQVVLSDHVSPLSSLSAAIASPMSRTSWRKSTTSRTTNNDNTSLSSCFDDDEEVISSPRTSIGSEDISNGFLKVEQQYNDKRKKAASFSSFISSFKKDGNNIIFESKYNAPTLSIPASNNEKKPFWLYTQGDEKEYDRYAHISCCCNMHISNAFI